MAHLRPDHRVHLPRSDPGTGVGLSTTTTTFIPITDGQLAVEDSVDAGTARDRTAIVLLHGFAMDRSGWDPQFASLAEQHRTIRYDLRGFGASGPPRAGRHHVDDLVELLDACDIDRAHLVGLSLGANVALGALVERRDRVASAVLASPGLPGLAWTTPRPPEQAAAHAKHFGIDAARRYWLDHDLFVTARTRPEVSEPLARMTDRFPAWQWQDVEQAAALPVVHERLDSISTPTLVLHGSRDLPGYHKIAVLLGTEIRTARRTEFAGCGHFVNLEQPTDFTRAVLDFIDAG